MRVRNIIYIITAFLLVIGSAVALDVGLDVSPSGEAWVEEKITVSSTCDSDASVYGKITGERIANLPQFTYSDHHETSFYPSLLLNTLNGGIYEINVTCEKDGDSNSETTTINLYGLSVDILNPKTNDMKVYYPGDNLNIELNFAKDGEALYNNVEFKVKLGDTTIFDTESGDIAVYNSQTENWEIVTRIPETSLGTYDVTVLAKYKNHEVTKTSYNAIEVKPLIDVEIIKPLTISPYKLSGSEDMNIALKILYKSNPVSMKDISGFSAKLDDIDLTIKDVLYSENNWTLIINIPEFKPSKDTYNLDIYVNYKGIEVKARDSIPLQFLLKFEGNILDASGLPIVDAEIKLEGFNFEEKSVTGSSGNYSLRVPPGTYDIEMLLPEMKAKLFGVELTNEDGVFGSATDLIRYDHSLDTTVDDMTVAKLVALEFGLPFDKAYIEIPYMDSSIMDEEKITVLKCGEWNFGRRSCLGSWKDIDIEVDTIRNVVSFEVDSLSAFVITEEKTISLDAQIDKDNYYLGEDVKITGSVKDDRGNGVSGAEVSYSVKDATITGLVTTDASGSFTVTFKAPDKVGSFDVEVSAKKDSYSTKKVIKTFKTYKKEGLVISSPSSIEASLDESYSMKFTIENNGQKSIRYIELTVDGLPSDWYDLSVNRIGELNEGESKEIELTILIKKENCEVVECKSQYSLVLTADSDETTVTQPLTLNLKGLEVKKPEEGGITGFFAGITGFFAEQLQNLAIIVLIVIALFFVDTKRRNIKIPKTSSLKLFHLNKVKSETLKSRRESKKSKKPEKLRVRVSRSSL